MACSVCGQFVDHQAIMTRSEADPYTGIGAHLEVYLAAERNCLLARLLNEIAGSGGRAKLDPSTKGE